MSSLMIYKISLKSHVCQGLIKLENSTESKQVSTGTSSHLCKCFNVLIF